MKDLNQKLAELLGIESKWAVKVLRKPEYELYIFDTYKLANDYSDSVSCSTNIYRIEPDFTQPENFVKLLEIVTKNVWDLTILTTEKDKFRCIACLKTMLPHRVIEENESLEIALILMACEIKQDRFKQQAQSVNWQY